MTRVIPKKGIAIAFCAVFCCAHAAYAEDTLLSRLLEDRIGSIEPGLYSAGAITFTLSQYRDKYLLRFAGLPEIYVLYPDHGTLGGKVLKFDSGVTAIAVAGWGGVTLYTDDQPSGIPAERTDDSIAPVLSPISLADMQSAAGDETEHLAYVRQLRLAFAADWNALSNNAPLRALAFDAMENAARGIERFTASAAAKIALAQKIDSVRMQPAAKPTISLSGKTLVVTFNGDQGFVGRASSRAIAHALGKLLSIPTPG